jgi:7SK snRNA methylphosphate capping enzyme
MENPYLAHTNQNEKTSSRRSKINIIKDKPSRSAKLYKKRVLTVHGNYLNYYGYRNKEGIKDPRISKLNPEWFSNKDVLDIGCNSGVLTLEIANVFNPKSITGVDIDPQLIRNARWNLQSALSRVSEEHCDLNYFPISAQEQFGLLPIVDEFEGFDTIPEHVQVSNEAESSNHFKNVFKRIYFRLSDWVHESFMGEKYDIILALSITKWIHLNNGDGGIRHFFNKVHKSLHKNGIFILEPQDFKGYKKRAGMTMKMLTNYKELEFLPEHFNGFLVKKVGFKLLQVIEPENAQDGFDRIIYIYQKK